MNFFRSVLRREGGCRGEETLTLAIVAERQNRSSRSHGAEQLDTHSMDLAGK